MKKHFKKLRNGGVVAATSISTAMLNVQAATAQTQLGEGVNGAKPEGAAEELFTDGGVFQTIADVLLFLVGAVSVIMLIIGGIRYVISAGDQQAVTNAKNTILYAIVGIVVAFLAFAAVRFVVDQLEGNG